MNVNYKDQSFESVPLNAPEYTDEILWHRVLLVVVSSMLVLAIIIWGVLKLTRSAPAPFDPSQLPATASIPNIQVETSGVIERTPEQKDLDAIQTAMVEEAIPAREKADSDPFAAAPNTAEMIAMNESYEPVAESVATETIITEPRANEASTLASADMASAEPETIEAETVNTTQTNPSDPYHIDVETFTNDVTHASISDLMDGLEPAHDLESAAQLTDDFVKLYFFTDIRGRAGDVITYYWQHDGKTVAKVRIPIHSNRWRSHSSKNITKKMRGDWEVFVKDKTGNVLAKSSFSVPNSKS